jgi:hypothetical protein
MNNKVKRYNIKDLWPKKRREEDESVALKKKMLNAKLKNGMEEMELALKY